MSTPPRPFWNRAGARALYLHWIARGVAVLFILLSLPLMWCGEQARIADDLQLCAPAAARPGQSIALRAYYFRDVEAPEGPELASAPVQVRLLDQADRVVQQTVLTPRPQRGMEGALTLPQNARDPLWIEAEVPGRRPALRVRHGLRLADDAKGQPLWGREAGPLQHLSMGPLQAISGAPPPSPLWPRVAGGACVPEQPCTLLVWVGEPAAALRLRETASASITVPPEPAGEQAGVVQAVVVVHGPEGELLLSAYRGGKRVAERRLRLPVALGEAAVSVPVSLVDPGEPLTLWAALAPGRTFGILDLFAEGHWRATRSFEGGPDGVPLNLPAELLAPGILRLQVRSSLFDSDGAGVRVVYARHPGETTRQIAQRIARRLGAVQQPPSVLNAGELRRLLEREGERAIPFALAPLEALRAQIPRPVSARPARLRELNRRQTMLRYGVGVGLSLSAVLIGVSLLRRGLTADDQARSILDLAGQASGERLAPSRSGTRFVVLFSLGVCLAFLAAALLIVAKPLWF